MGMDHRDRSSAFQPPPPPMDRERILDREQWDRAIRRSRSRERGFRERDRDRERERDKDRELMKDNRADRDIRYATIGLKSNGGNDLYDPSRNEREQRAKKAAE